MYIYRERGEDKHAIAHPRNHRIGIVNILWTTKHTVTAPISTQGEAHPHMHIRGNQEVVSYQGQPPPHAIQKISS